MPVDATITAPCKSISPSTVPSTWIMPSPRRVPVTVAPAAITVLLGASGRVGMSSYCSWTRASSSSSRAGLPNKPIENLSFVLCIAQVGRKLSVFYHSFRRLARGWTFLWKNRSDPTRFPILWRISAGGGKNLLRE